MYITLAMYIPMSNHRIVIRDAGHQLPRYENTRSLSSGRVARSSRNDPDAEIPASGPRAAESIMGFC